MNHRAVIATHHKTGTAWMSKVFRAIAARLDIPVIHAAKRVVHPEDVPIPAIVLNDHSDFSQCEWMFTDANTRLLHLIRDPRDVIISAMHYHRTAREPWLHKPRSKFGQQSYQQRLNGLGDEHSQYIWEMDNTGLRIINAMRKWNYSMKHTIELRYEDLINDIGGDLFSTAVAHLGFIGPEIGVCRREFGKRHLSNKRKATSHHVRSGEARQWEPIYDAALAEAFINRFGDVLIDLGYETDNLWAKCRSSGTKS
ncbi:MAG TPA: sulfotransferase domain-containing protein [Rhizomicrobium sp.]|jgi:hypothetical protein